MVPAVTGRAELPHGRVLLGGIVALALAVHLVGIRKDLPYAPEIDEPLVVNAAVRIGALIDTDPGWFVSTGMYGRYLAEPARYPAEVAFYSRLFREGQLLQAFAPSATSRGPMIRIYRIARAPAVPP